MAPLTRVLAGSLRWAGGCHRGAAARARARPALHLRGVGAAQRRRARAGHPIQVGQVVPPSAARAPRPERPQGASPTRNANHDATRDKRQLCASATGVACLPFWVHLIPPHVLRCGRVSCVQSGTTHLQGEDAQSADAEYPEERLAFALADGRVGMLAVKVRRV